MTQSPLISVIMPAFNAANFIGESIQSVLGQTFTGFELIIVDDGSEDNTKKIIAQYERTDQRVKYIYQPTGRQGKARNTGIQQARGYYIAFIDADDLWDDTKLEKQLTHIKQPDAALVFSACNIIDENGNLLGTTPPTNATVYTGVDGLEAFLTCNRIALSSVLAKKSALKAAHNFEENAQIQYGEDYFLWLRMLLNGDVFVGTVEILASYRKHSAQSIRQTQDKALQIVRGLSTLTVPPTLVAKKRATERLWIKRYLSANRSITKEQLTAVINFIPFSSIKNVSRWFIPIIPERILATLIKLTI